MQNIFILFFVTGRLYIYLAGASFGLEPRTFDALFDDFGNFTDIRVFLRTFPSLIFS
jgi:hypothetical protein